MYISPRAIVHLNVVGLNLVLGLPEDQGESSVLGIRDGQSEESDSKDWAAWGI